VLYSCSSDGVKGEPKTEMVAIQKAISDVVDHRCVPDAETIAEVIEEIHNHTATEAQLAGLIVGLSMLAREMKK